MKCQYRNRIAHYFCNKHKPFQTFFKQCSKIRMTSKRATLVWFLQGAWRREFHYIVCHSIIGNSFQCQKARVLVSQFPNDNEEFHRNWKKYSIDNDFLWNPAVFFVVVVLILGIKLHPRWERSFNAFVFLFLDILFIHNTTSPPFQR